MEPMSPVIPHVGAGLEVTFAKNQPEYNPLPTLCTEQAVMSRWHLSDAEREHIANGGDLFIIQLNRAHPLQPILPFCGTDEQALTLLTER